MKRYVEPKMDFIPLLGEDVLTLSGLTQVGWNDSWQDGWSWWE